MVYYLIICRSLTYAQRTAHVLERAGIGVSENSDAVVAIVSEETGSISVAVNGMLKRHLSPDTLERLLRMELMPAADGENGPVTAAARLTSVFKGIKGDNSNGKEDS